MKIPLFKDFENWMEFKTTLNSVINSNTSLADIHKFQLLCAERIIDNVEFSENQFTNVWQALCDRFKKYIC